jgi:hypothetical protein
MSVIWEGSRCGGLTMKLGGPVSLDRRPRMKRGVSFVICL